MFDDIKFMFQSKSVNRLTLTNPNQSKTGHDYSVRLWNFDTKRCIKETKSHIEKFSEAILDVSFHPTQKFFATSGSDAKAICFSISN